MDSERAAPAPKVFISYRREDTAGHAGRLFDAIVARFGDHHVFMDVDLAPGVDFANRITEAIGGSDVLLVIHRPEMGIGGPGGERAAPLRPPRLRATRGRDGAGPPRHEGDPGARGRRPDARRRRGPGQPAAAAAPQRPGAER